MVMSRSHCIATEHDFDKFDAATIYCRKCGEQRVMDVQALIAQLPQPIYLPCPGPHYPTYPTWVWRPQPWYGTITSGTVSTSDTVTVWNDNTTFTGMPS
jgi:hypothetical protein